MVFWSEIIRNMSTGKRLAKRSILGTRVSAPFDGHYYSGIIQGIKNENPIDNRDALYSVLFDNKINGRKLVLDFMAQDLIGSGFQTINNIALNRGQKVFITHNGREVSAFVDTHNIATDVVFLSVDLSSNNNKDVFNSTVNQNIQVRRRLDECRLSESRKSARLIDLDTDYSKLADYRGRTSSISSTISSSSITSSHIDVPVVQHGRKRRPSGSDDDVIDDCMAAMVLMSLSCSPQSSLSSQLSEARIVYQCTWPGCNHQYDSCHQIEQHVRTIHLGRTDLKDIDDKEEEFYYTEIEINDNSLPPSDSSSSSSPGPQSPTDSVDENCKSESQSPIPSPHSFFPSSSAPVWSHLEDHEYLKYPIPLEDNKGEIKIKFIQNLNANNFAINKRSGLINGSLSTPLSAPINIPGTVSTTNQPFDAQTYANSAPSLHSPRIHHKFMRLSGNHKAVVGGTTLLQTNLVSKQSPTKRVRGESRKCRKVYGMDNRDLWCTQCKWKKACSRFTD